MRSERCCAIARHLMTLIQNGLMTHSGKNKYKFAYYNCNKFISN